MQYYVELTLLPAFEVPRDFLMSKIFQQIHLAFVDRKNEIGKVPYGVSFPQYNKQNKTLGDKVRIFSEYEDLKNLNLKKWLVRFFDYVHISSIREAPTQNVKYAVFKRVRETGSQGNKARRFLKRHEDCKKSLEEMAFLFAQKQKNIECPFLKLSSLTNRNSFPVYIEQKESSVEKKGSFGTYGLSNEDTTVPIF